MIHSRHTSPQPRLGPSSRRNRLWGCLWVFLAAASPLLARVDIKPGFNTFTPEQDVELGREAAQEVEKEFALVSDSQLSEYLNRLGQNLARHAPGRQFPYQFRLIHAKELNAFALPGGPIYVHTGIVLAAANEAQLAGVLAHEISHIALRHSTNQASKAMLTRAPLAILGGVLSGGGLGGQLAQLGIAFGIQSAFLKFSREAERQADQLGAQILYDAGYDPRAMAQFFETLEKESGSRGGVEFFSSHPNPGNRMRDVAQLIPSLGPSKDFSIDNTEFEPMKRRAADLQDPRQGEGERGAVPRDRPVEPSRRFQSFDAEWFRMGYPDNWQVYGQGSSAITLVPPEGVVQVGENALPAIAYGALISVFEPYREAGRRLTLTRATEQLVRELQRSNSNLRVTGRARTFRRPDGQEFLSRTAAGESPLAGETEVNWIVTTLRPQGLWYVVFIAPQSAWRAWEPTFQQMLDSVRFPR